MKETKNTVGGWMWYVASLRQALPEGTVLDYKHLMKQYINGVKWEDAL